MNKQFFLPILLLFLFFYANNVTSQSKGVQQQRCSTVEHQKLMQQKNPSAFQNQADFESWMAQKLLERKQNPTWKSGEIVIPVVVHVIHNGDAVGTNENISEAQILSQVQVLNEDFGKMIGSRGYNDDPVGVDTRIEWCMAQTDPNGNPTDGINRVNLGQADWTSAQFDATAKPATQWDPTQYCNVWVAELSGGTLGYAQFPEGSGLPGMPTTPEVANTDGVVMTANAFGTADADDGTFYLNPTYNLGRTMTHEVGHWLGLRHIWGDDACGVDDFVTDTPESDAPNYSCVTHTSCSTVDMIENYMDYTNDACMNIFTVGQKARIDVVMANSPRRMELATSNKCTPLTEISFSQSKATTTENGAIDNACLDYQEISLDLRISGEPTSDATVDFTLGGTAVEGEDYDFITPKSLTFPAGQNVFFTVVIHVYDDAYIEAAETVELSYSITTSGDAVGGGYNQSYTLTINDNDIDPLLFPIEVLSEDFESGLGAFTTTTSGTDAFVAGLAADASAGYYIIEGINSSNIAYISDDNCNCDLSDVRLISPVFSTEGGSNARMTFDHAFANVGETFDILVSTDGGATWGASIQSITNTSVSQGSGVYETPWVNGYSLDLSAYDNMPNLRIAFQYNDGGAWSYGLAIDNVGIYYEGIAPIQSSMNTGAAQEQYLGPNGTINFYDPTSGNIMMTIENLSSHDYGCTTVEVNRAGAGAEAAWSNNAADYIASKTYSVSPTTNNPTGAYNVTLYYTDAEVTGWANATGKLSTDLNVIKTKNDITNPQTSDDREYSLMANNAFGADHAFQANFSSGFSDFGIGPVTALPIELLYFRGEHKDTHIELEWLTEVEVNSAYFQVEHSVNGQSFEQLNQVAAAGTSTGSQAYTYNHINFSSGSNYYRLKMVDIDGSFTYSKIIHINSNIDPVQININPNPVKGSPTITVASGHRENVVINVIDVAGRVLLSKNVDLETGDNSFFLDIENLATGVYFLQVKNSKQARPAKKFVKH